jgi:hypothetical protein
MVWEITPEELLERYADRERNFAGIDLIKYHRPSPYSPKQPYRQPIELKNVVLRDINLRGANFEEICLTGVDLTGADLGGIFMRDCRLVKGIIRDLICVRLTCGLVAFSRLICGELTWIT